MEKIIQKLEAVIEKLSNDFTQKPIGTIIKLAIIIWIAKTAIKFLKDEDK